MLTIRSFFILLSVQWPGFVSFFWLRFFLKNPCTHFTVCTLKRRSVWGTTSEKSFYQEQMSSNYHSYHMAFAYLPYTSHWTTCVWIVEGDFPFSPPSPCPPSPLSTPLFPVDVEGNKWMEERLCSSRSFLFLLSVCRRRFDGWNIKEEQD